MEPLCVSLIYAVIQIKGRYPERMSLPEINTHIP